MLRGQKVPVFDELVCLERSELMTFIAELQTDLEALQLLSSVADDLGEAAED